MPLTITVNARVQTAAKKLPINESRILGEFMRLVLANGVRPSSAASTAHAKLNTVKAVDKDLAYGATMELVISSHNRVFFRESGSIITLTNLVPVASTQ